MKTKTKKKLKKDSISNKSKESSINNEIEQLN